MGVQFEHVRVVAVAPFVADPDPNASAPAANAVFTLKDRPPYGPLTTSTQGHSLFLDFRDAAGAMVPGARATLRAWFLDETSGLWTPAAALPDVPHIEAYITADIKSAKLFVQVLSVVPGAATTLTVRVMEIDGEGAGYRKVGGAEPVEVTAVISDVDQGDPNTLANGWPVKLTDGLAVLGTVANPLQVSDIDTPAATATVSDVLASGVTVTLLAANASRISCTIFNDSNKALTIKLGAGASAVSRTAELPPKMEWTPDARYTGVITGFWAAGATGSAAVTELTP